MSLLWYLPSFVTLVVLRAVIEHAGPAGKRILLLALVALHPFIGLLAPRIQDFLPLGLLPVLYAIPLCYFAAYVHARVFESHSRALGMLASAVLFGVVKYLQMRAHLHNELGAAEVGDYTQPFAMLVNDLEAVTGVWMIFQLGRFPLGRFIDMAGKFSLQVYCFHAFIAAIIYKTLSSQLGSFPSLSLFLMSITLTAILTVTLARFLMERPLFRHLMFPKTTGELMQAFRILPFHPVQGHRN